MTEALSGEPTPLDSDTLGEGDIYVKFVDPTVGEKNTLGHPLAAAAKVGIAYADMAVTVHRVWNDNPMLGPLSVAMRPSLFNHGVCSTLVVQEGFNANECVLQESVLMWQTRTELQYAIKDLTVVDLQANIALTTKILSADKKS